MKNNRTIHFLPTKERAIVAKLVADIAELLQPLMIFYIASSFHKVQQRSIFPLSDMSESYLMDIKLLVVSNTQQDLASFAVKDNAIVDKVNYELIHTDILSVIRRLNTYNLFYCWLYKNGILLYETDDAFNRLPAPVFSRKTYIPQIADWYSQFPDLHSGMDITLHPKPADAEPIPNADYKSSIIIHNTGHLTVIG
jgi:hypothetical protein